MYITLSGLLSLVTGSLVIGMCIGGFGFYYLASLPFSKDK